MRTTGADVSSLTPGFFETLRIPLRSGRGTAGNESDEGVVDHDDWRLTLAIRAGLIAQAVMDRTREIGIRMALGATPAGTIGRVTMSGVTVAATGVVAGTALAAGATRFVTAWLWGVDQRDPLTFAAIAGLLLLVATIASALPALRIVRIDPATILHGRHSRSCISDHISIIVCSWQKARFL